MVKQLIDERRDSVRAKRILSIQFRLVKSKNKDTDTHWHLSTTHDMSYSGLSFLSDIAYQMNDTLELQVVMSGVLDIFKGYAKVMRVEKKETGAFYLIGVKFAKSNLLDNKEKKSVSRSAKLKK